MSTHDEISAAIAKLHPDELDAIRRNGEYALLTLELMCSIDIAVGRADHDYFAAGPNGTILAPELRRAIFGADLTTGAVLTSVVKAPETELRGLAGSI
ncbi:hypothetical protein LWF01_00305 [Saxibacter everestensis]|uniref:Uncharacterized protein n=1 Tax=Saxibacter everestensis TaxID=2909229 RepID=A0ABY8QTL5_9MICO|nr:hypothetical protein LWF01_00305 [Brevibacteriaceae bacterium ZFBP1038]